MHIEVFKSELSGQWHWHFKNKGRVTADSEAFPTKNNASRAARAVVSAVVKEMGGFYMPSFMHAKWVSNRGVWKIEWY